MLNKEPAVGVTMGIKINVTEITVKSFLVVTLAVLMTAPYPVHTQQPRRQAFSSGTFSAICYVERRFRQFIIWSASNSQIVNLQERKISEDKFRALSPP